MIETYLNQTAYRYTKTGYDKYGKPTTGGYVPFKTRIQGTKSRIIREDGAEFGADMEMWVGGDFLVAMDDKVRYQEENYKVVKISAKRDINGAINHKKVYLLRTKE